MAMHTERLLVIAVLMALSLGVLSPVTTTKSTPAKAQAKVFRLVLVNEPAIRIQFGVIQFQIAILQISSLL